MNGMFQHVLGVVLLCSYALASTDNSYPLGSSESLPSDEPRIFFGSTGTTTTGSFVTFNSTLLLFSAGILLTGIAGALVLFFLLTTPEDSSSYGNSGYSDSGSSYSAYNGRDSKNWKFNPYGMNWESLNILDWVSMGQEAWDKFDPSNLDCQKRLICEIHQNQSKLGAPAKTMVEIFGYLQYAEILSLPDELKMLLEEYMEASEKGRTMQKDCGQVYMACDFSMNGMLNKFSTNEI